MSIMLSRETIKLMMNVQRKVKEEFGVRISLDDDNASAMLMAYASRSQSDELRSSGNDLALSMIPNTQITRVGQTSEKAHHMKQRVYRGQVVGSEPTTPMATDASIAQDLEGSVVESENKSTIIYRGHRVTV